MASTINTNINSLTAQRNLSVNQMSLSTSMQRLSSGLRINSAKDDAAGLAISDRMTAQIRGQSQAARNANDGISLAQTAEGALGEITTNLQRIRELAVQSANSTNTASDRASLDLEVQQRIKEIDRVSSQTQFNGRNLLDGSFGTAVFQVGANVSQTIELDLTDSKRTTNLGRRADYIGSAATFDGTKAIGAQGAGVSTASLASGDLKITVGNNAEVTVGASTVTATENAKGQTSQSAFAKVRAINQAGVPGLRAEANTTIKAAYTTTTVAYSMTINGTQVFNAAASGLTGEQFAEGVNRNAGATGVTASFSGGNITLTAADGRDIIVTAQTNDSTGLGAASTVAGENNTLNAALTTTGTTAWTAVGTVRLSANERIDLVGAGAAAAGFAAGGLALGSSSLYSASVTSVANANSTIDAIDSALAGVSTLRSTFGAIQNRFESVVANLASSVENLSASRSRIQDADFATETANLSRSQILQQAGTAMVAQANQLPQGVLALLR
ncbi:flagellin [Rhodoferax aquaticus]|uniref:Flagellin n=1 Tax=Rhodoferax aquaticus TaxID=2527691 RepID=A0A515EU40_9BURK|nr:flagellin [Rhodoferax aquaticus]QDL56093.1 flagellin [Rhodoferax aquaticus]